VLDNKILFLPPADLCGSFGDDIMTVAFLEMNKKKQLTLYCNRIIKRKDLFNEYKNLMHLSYDIVPMFSKYMGGVFLMGADIMTGSYGKNDVLFKCRILNEADRHNLKTSILGFSLNNDINLEIKKTFVNLLPRTIFNLREDDSFIIAEKFLKKSNLKLVADIAFLCPFYKNNDKCYLSWIKNQKKRNKIIAGVCPNSIQAQRVGKEYYVKQIISLLQYMNNKYDLSFALFYHDLRLDESSDRNLSEEIYRFLGNSMDLFYTKNILNGVQLKSYLEYIDFTIAGRMHFGISGYSLEKPMFGIAYEGKFSGLQKMFGIPVEKSIVDYTRLNESKKIADLFMENLNIFSAAVQKNLPTVLELSKKNFEL
jgi:polysaccharide pyruvyl transferase WcaK-like protein